VPSSMFPASLAGMVTLPFSWVWGSAHSGRRRDAAKVPLLAVSFLRQPRCSAVVTLLPSSKN
jgi:hypothetical protein